MATVTDDGDGDGDALPRLLGEGGRRTSVGLMGWGRISCLLSLVAEEGLGGC